MEIETSGVDRSGALLTDMRPGDQVTAPESDARWRKLPLLAMVIAGLALCAFFLYSQTHHVSFGYFSHPPIYGKWRPAVDPFALLVIPAGLLLSAVAWCVVSGRRMPTWLALTLVVVAGVLAAMAVNLVPGDWGHLLRGLSTARNSPFHTSDLHYVYELGVRGFGEQHPELAHVFNSWNSRTHPPGVLVLLYGLFRAFGSSHTFQISTTIAFLGMGAAISAWSIGRTFGGERSGRIAAVLLAAAPGPLLLAYTAIDAVFATFLTAAVAMFVLAIHRSSAAWAGLAGAVLGVGTYLTYATAFVALAATIAVVLQVSGVRNVIRLLGSAAIGGLLVLVAERLFLGFDVLASYSSVPGDSREYDPYWIAASPAAFLIFAGVPLAGLGMLGLFAKIPGARRPVLPLVLVSIMFVWATLPSEVTHLRPGEVERTWAFLYPLLAACAAPIIERWTRSMGRWSGAVLGGLVALSIAQAALLQALWDTIF